MATTVFGAYMKIRWPLVAGGSAEFTKIQKNIKENSIPLVAFRGKARDHGQGNSHNLLWPHGTPAV